MKEVVNLEYCFLLWFEKRT